MAEQAENVKAWLYAWLGKQKAADNNNNYSNYYNNFYCRNK